MNDGSSSGSTGDADWSDEDAEWLLGLYALVGVTTLDAQGVEISVEQFHGRVSAADRSNGVVIDCEGNRRGETRTLPPTTSAFSPAGPGEYRLRSTGEIVVDPDVTAQWTVTEPRRS